MIEQSDNDAATTLLADVGGPAGVTRFDRPGTACPAVLDAGNPAEAYRITTIGAIGRDVWRSLAG
jgi:hypothetical protein